MEFKLNEYHRDVPEEALLEDLKRVAEIIGTGRLSRSDYQKHGKFGTTTIERRFGGWNSAIIRIGLVVIETGNQKRETLVDEDSFFEDLRQVAVDLGKESITTGEYDQFGRFSRSGCCRKYGSWNILLQKAGLKPTPYRLGKGKEISDEELFQDIERVWIKLGRQPTINDVKNGEFNFAQNTFTRRFGGWRGALEAFVKYINSDSEDGTEVSNEDALGSISNELIVTDSNCQKPKQSNFTTHKTRRDVNLRLRFRVMQRDKFKCCKCGKSPATDPTVIIQVDHVIPWSLGGETVMENLQTLCSECNYGKGNLLEE